MNATLRLTLSDYVDPTRWRWVLSDARGRFLADHEVRLDPTAREYAGFVDVRRYLDFFDPANPIEGQVATLGAWIGDQVFGGPAGGVRDALWAHRTRPALPVAITLPRAAHDAGLLLRPFELARFADGRPFHEAGVRFVYEVEEAAAAPRAAGRAKTPAGDTLRVLAAFSLPSDANPLDLRRERHGLQQLVRELAQTRGAAVDLRVLHYGTTRQSLRDAIEEGDGWDVVHLSCHGEAGVLLLEDGRGKEDVISADDLGELLDPTVGRLKLLILDTCYSAAGATDEAQGSVTPAAGAPTVLPGVAQALSARLDCAALAMRYPVEDTFTTDLMLSLYEKLLDRGRPLPAALHLALDDVLAPGAPQPGIARPPLSAATPLLVGSRAGDLHLEPPDRAWTAPDLPSTGLRIGFPPEPPRFVGHVLPMLHASQALAPRSEVRGVLFTGMAGVGKTACALELAYRHEERRFRGYVCYRGPEAAGDVAGALPAFLSEIESQLTVPTPGLSTAVQDPASFRTVTLPRLRALLGEYSLLLVLDHLDLLLAAGGRWRDPLWGDVIEALLGHDGRSRVVLTSRRVPASLEGHARLRVEQVKPLSDANSSLLMRDLPNLKRLLGDPDGLDLLRRTRRVAMGLPALLWRADEHARDREELERWLVGAEEQRRKGEVELSLEAGDDGRAVPDAD